ncbi:MAG: hypothetical protein J7M05_07655 [Anaerolineae bacterium]|nr:hypothetical protein [Anaerolineae bacterium]
MSAQEVVFRKGFLFRRGLGWAVASLVLLGVAVFLLRGWLFTQGLPISPRREVLTELTIVWMFREELRQGRMLSEWNPFWFSGFPWLRFLSYPLYYGLAGLSLMSGLALERILVLFYLLVLWASGLTMFAYLYALLDDWRPALVGAAIYELSPFHNHVGVETWIHAAFWALLPLPLWAIERAQRARGARRIHYLLLIGVALGWFPIISSEYAILAGPFVVAYFILRELSGVWRQRRNLGQAVGELALAGVVALGVATFFVLPAIKEVPYVGIHAKHGMGTTFTNKLIRDYSVTPGLVWYAVARRFRLPFHPRVEALPGIVRSFWSIAWYPGIVVLALAILGVRAARRRFAAFVALVGTLVMALFVMGPTCPLNFFSRLPVMGRLSPFRGMMLLVAALAVLAAFGVEEVLRRIKGRWLVVGVVSGLVLLVGVDFWPSARAYQTVPAYFSEEEQEAYAWLARHMVGNEGRLWEVAALPRDQYLRSYALSLLPTPRHVGYYDNGAPLHTWEQAAWTDLQTVLHLHQVRYVLTHQGEQDVAQVEEQLRKAGYRLAFLKGGVRIWENPANGQYVRFYPLAALDLTHDFHYSFRALPQFVWRNVAMVSPEGQVSEDELKRYRYLLVEQKGELSPSAEEVEVDDLAALPAAKAGHVSAWVERLSFEDIYMEVHVPSAGVLTIAESWYPNWRVRIDEQPARVLRVNWALLGVWLPAGSHRISFHCQRPWYVYVGYLVSLLTFVALLLWWTWYLSRLVGQPKVFVQGYPEQDDKESV